METRSRIRDVVPIETREILRFAQNNPMRFPCVVVPPARKLSLALAVVLLLLCFAASNSAQESPIFTVDDECTALAYAPDGRIAYAVRHILNTRRLEIQRDDIWVLGSDGKRRRIVNGERLVRGPAAFSYAIQSLRWAPDGQRLTVEMLTSQMINDRGDTKEGVLTLLIDEHGREIKIEGADSVIPGGTNAAWLADGVTVVYLQEAVKPKLLYSIQSVRPIAGRTVPLFADHTFAAAAWNAKESTGIGVERERSLSGPPRLVTLDLLNQTSRNLVTLDGFAGELTLSPSGKKVAYFRDHEVLEIRDLAAPERVARVRALYGPLRWTQDERRILLKRSPEHRSGDLVWITVPTAEPVAVKSVSSSQPIPEAEAQPVLHGVTFRDFQISPDGRFLAVIQVGKRNLLVYPLQ